MEESIKKAKEKAEDLLFQSVKNISDGLKSKDNVLLGHPFYIPINLEFEAHAYLAHRNKKLKPRYADELREILVNWIQKKNGDKSKIADIFFPSYPHEGTHLESIALLRAIEILDIPGFQKNIDSAINSMKEFLIENPIDFTDYSFNEWFIFRSKTIQRKLRDYIQIAALLIFEKMRNSKITIEDVLSHKSDKDKAYYLPFWIVGSIFLVMSKQGEEISNYAKYTIDRIISTQEENGSVFNDVLTTCSFIIAVYLTNTDPAKIALRKAMNWLLNQQKINGSWNYSQSDHESHEVISTVIVLEILDLITNDEPLPWWIIDKKQVSLDEKRGGKPFLVRPFPTSADTSWGDISIEFLSASTAKISIGDYQEERDFAEMGFADRRTKNVNPNLSWWHLLEFARSRGKIEWEFITNPNKKAKLRKNIETLSDKLKKLFEKMDDLPYTCLKTSCYELKFKKISIGRDVALNIPESTIGVYKLYTTDGFSDKDVRDVYAKSIQDRVDERIDSIDFAIKREVEGSKENS